MPARHVVAAERNVASRRLGTIAVSTSCGLRVRPGDELDRAVRIITG